MSMTAAGELWRALFGNKPGPHEEQCEINKSIWTQYGVHYWWRQMWQMTDEARKVWKISGHDECIGQESLSRSHLSLHGNLLCTVL
jgi:hypothetical protein